jgi:hypothetical protein
VDAQPQLERTQPKELTPFVAKSSDWPCQARAQFWHQTIAISFLTESIRHLRQYLGFATERGNDELRQKLQH